MFPRSTLLFAFMVAITACAQAQCDHASEPSSVLYQDSAFVHGYRHGYQSGFESADLSLHLDQSFDPQRSKEYRDVKRTAHSAKSSAFERGYRAGFLKGAKDMMGGMSFRLFRILHAGELRAATNPIAIDREAFDAGVVRGYAGTQQDPTSCTNDSSAAICIGRSVGDAIAKEEHESGTERAANASSLK